MRNRMHNGRVCIKNRKFSIFFERAIYADVYTAIYVSRTQPLGRKIKQIKKVAKLLLQDLKNGLTPALKLIGSLELGGCN